MGTGVARDDRIIGERPLAAIGGGSATLRRFGQAHTASAAPSPHRTLAPSGGLRERLQAAVDGFVWAPDLGQDIGSPLWWRGMATLALLVTLALASWPGVRPVASDGAALPSSDWAAQERQAIEPLALGSDTGSRMAPTDVVRPLPSAPERPRVELVAMLGASDALPRALQRAGVNATDAAQASALVAAAMPLANIPAGTRIDLVLGKRDSALTARPLEELRLRAALDLKLVVRRSGAALALERQAIAVTAAPLRLRVAVGPGLYRAARAADVPPSAIQEWLRAVDARVPVRDLTTADVADFVVEQRRAGTGEVEYGGLLYAGLDRASGERLRMAPWNIGGQRQWLEAGNLGEQRSALGWPVAGRMTSAFGMRVHPILRFARMHSGIDIGAAWGSPVYATADGVVDWASYRGGYGRYVRVQHGDGLATAYAHMSGIAVGQGAFVRRGQLVGYVGSSGLSTGPHLHYEVYRNGVAVNPMGANSVVRALLDAGQQAAFRARIDALTRLPVGAAAAR